MPDPFAYYLRHAAPLLLAIAIPLLGLYALQNLYAGRRLLRRHRETWKILRANALMLLVMYGILYLCRQIHHPRSLWVLVFGVNVVLTVLARAALAGVLTRATRACGFDVCPALLVGSAEETVFVRDWLAAVRPKGLRVVAELAVDPAGSDAAVADQVRAALTVHAVPLVIVADPRIPFATVMRLVRESGEWGVALKILSPYLTVLTQEARMEVDLVCEIPLVHFGRFPPCPLYRAVKRALSTVAAAAVLILLLPVWLATAALVRLTSRGPVFFVQDRVGYQGRLFPCLKFRTMYEDAALRQAEMEVHNESDGILFKIRNDPRVTPVGRVLRRFSLDEIPQLINVLRGDMVLVGPRPLPLRDVEKFSADWHAARHAGRPGLTGLWQVSGRSDIDFHRMCILDIYYLRNQSLLFDAVIALRTVVAVLFGSGAY
jgi:exopolysaccharide biosynthesis polyprenyl glycosylphosphotransferase